MFGFGKKKKKMVEVVFTEDGKKEPFAVTEMPVQQLPDSFEIDTNLNIGDELWVVVDADPKNKEDFAEQGVLNLRLSKTEMLDPNEILYSIPTINDEVGLISEFMQDIDEYFNITEDLWRQVELVSDSYDEVIDEELSSIMDIYNLREESGFKEIHLRQKITEPLKDSGISVVHLKDHFGVSKEYKGVIYSGQPFGVGNSYAFVSEDGITFWGEYNENEDVISICFDYSKPKDIERFCISLSGFLSDENLYFLDWCRVQKIYDMDPLKEYYSE